MGSLSALIPWNSRDGEAPVTLPVALRSDLQVTTVGPGRLLNQAFSRAGRGFEQLLGRAAHQVGAGPIATLRRIEQAFGHDTLTRQSRLDSIFDYLGNGTSIQKEDFLRVLEKECQKLLTYAFPSESLDTQLQAFSSIILLTTYYPGLRRIFRQSPDLKKVADSPEAICQLWKGAKCYATESYFTLELAAHCLARSDINIYLEAIRPSELGCTREEDLGVVCELVVRYCEEELCFTRLIAIRYLAGILDLPAFWSEKKFGLRSTMDKLCKQTLRLIEDIDPDSVDADDLRRLALFDPEGIDALAEAILVGGRKWTQQIKEPNSDYWLNNLIKLIKRLRRLTLPGLLPRAYQRAAENWEVLVKDMTDQLRKSSLDCRYEDVYDFAYGVQSTNPSWGPSNVVEELRKDDRPTNAFTSATSDRTISRNIVVFGETGSGKSSIINMLCQSAQQIVSGEMDGFGFTKDTAGYWMTIDDSDSPLKIWDTPGLLEGGEATIQTVEALHKIHRLVEDLNQMNQTVNLLVYCIRAPRFGSISRINYDLVAKLICEEKVPVIAVINGLENEDNMERWWKRNHKQFEKDMKLQNHVCVTTTMGEFNGKQFVFQKEYEESKKKLKDLIMATKKLADPWMVADFDSFDEKRKMYMEVYNSRTETERTYAWPNDQKINAAETHLFHTFRYIHYQ